MEYDILSDRIPNILEEWILVKRHLEELFKKRNQNDTLPCMEKGIDLYIKFLFWSNDQPVSQMEQLSSIPLDCKPVNLDERLAFIIDRPGLYHSFRQLSELMNEQEKLFAIKKIKKAFRQ